MLRPYCVQVAVRPSVTDLHGACFRVGCTGHHSVRPRARSFTTFPLSANDVENDADEDANHDDEDDDDDDGKEELLPTEET